MARVRRAQRVLNAKIQRPPRDRFQYSVNPRKSTLPGPLPACLPLGRSSKVHQARLVRMEGQSIHPHSLSQVHHHPLRIVLAFKSKDEVITIPDEDGLPPEVWRHVGFDPEIEGKMEVDVPEERGKD